MNGQTPKVSIVVLNWNGWQDTVECLKSIETLTYPNYEVVLIDNGSVDDSVAHICRWVATRPEWWGPVQDSPEAMWDILSPDAEVVLSTDRLTLIRSNENLGFAGGCNLAIGYALARDSSVRFVFLLNNDARVESDSLSACVAAAEREDAAIAGALIKSEDGQRVIFAGAKFPAELFRAARFRDYPDYKDCWSVDRVEGAAMLIRRDLLEGRRQQTGHFLNTSLFMYGEELELCIWAKGRGVRVVVAGRAVIRHREAAASGGEGSPLAYYYLTRNRVHLARELLSGWIKILFHLWYPLSRVIRAAHRALQGRREVAIAILEGLRDGYRGVHGRWRRHPEVYR